MSRRSSAAQVSQIPTFVERTDLPRIQVNTKGGARYSAYVNGYISGARCRVKGTHVVPIYYLSMVAMDGDGGKLQGIWAALVSNPPQDVYLEGVGTVVLAHHDPQFESLGYSLHWNYQQSSTNDRENTLHAVIESNMLTVCDPVVGAASVRRGRKETQKTRKERQRKVRNPAHIQLATVSKKELGDLAERTSREKHPLFMLMVPGNLRPAPLPEEAQEVYAAKCEEAERAYLAQLHFAFLDLRVPQPLSMDWADFLWQRALQAQECTRLTVWFKEAAQGNDDNEDQKAFPVIRSAWLCRPNIARLDADRRLALHSERKTALHEHVSGEVEKIVMPV